MSIPMQEPSTWTVQSYYGITLKKSICVGRTTVNTVPSNDKNEWFPVSMDVWRSYAVNWLYVC